MRLHAKALRFVNLGTFWGNELDEKHLAEAMAAMAMMGSGQSSFEQFWNSMPKSLHKIRQAEYRQATLSFSALQLVPELQHHSIRLQVLSMLAFLYCDGRSTLKKETVGKAFKLAGRSSAATLEDPPEDVFCANVCSDRGEFLLLEATDEGGGFFTQRLVNLFREMPNEEGFERNLNGPVFALLTLSNAALKRAGLYRYQQGSSENNSEIASQFLDQIPALSNALSFSNSELAELGISKEHLAHFDCSTAPKEKIKSEAFGSTLMNFHPLSIRPSGVDLFFPSLVSTAIRGFILKTLQHVFPKSVNPALAAEYENLIAASPYGPNNLGNGAGFSKVKGVWALNLTRKLDTGRYLHMFYFLDNLTDFWPENFGGAGANDGLSEALEFCVSHAAEEAQKDPEFIEGLTLVVCCGVGRGVIQGIPHSPSGLNWYIEAISIHDLEAAYWHPEHSEKLIWQARASEEAVNSFGVELFNANGLLNLIAWQQNLGGHIVPHAELPEDFRPSEFAKLMLSIPTDEILSFRSKSHQARDRTVLEDWEHENRTVVIAEQPRFGLRAVYGELEMQGEYPFVVVPDSGCNIWATINCPSGTERRFAIERLKLITAWLPRISETLSVAGLLSCLPRAILLTFRFSATAGSFKMDTSPDDAESALDFLETRSSHEKKITFELSSNFDVALHHPRNIAERELVRGIIDAVCVKYGLRANIEELTSSVVKDDLARYSHAFRATTFRHHFQHSFPQNPIIPNAVDKATNRLMLGWKYGGELAKAETRGVSECCALLKKVISGLEKTLVTELRTYEPTGFLTKVLNHHEGACALRESWKRSTGAILGLAANEDEAREDIIKQTSKHTNGFIGYRVLLEIGQVECGKDDQKPLGDFDLARLMAIATEIFNLGNASDAIRFGAMEPIVQIAPLGDVMMNWEFHEGTVNEYSTQNVQDGITTQRKRYAKYFDQSSYNDETEDQSKSEFAMAFEQEVGCRLEVLAEFLGVMQNHLIKREESFWDCTVEEFEAACLEENFEYCEEIPNIMNALCMPARSSWHEVPEGFLEKDKQPWRFRRMLSILRRPIIRYEISGQLRVIVSGGLLQDALHYMLDRYLEGDFDQHQLSSKLMRSWAGKVASKNLAFNDSVAEALRGLDLEAASDKNLSELTIGSNDLDVNGLNASGDVDALAWDRENGTVFAFECKQLQSKKTPGELAEQLSKYSGNGSKDKLRKHLARLTVLQRHKHVLSKVLGFEVTSVSGGLVFSDRVPMHFDQTVNTLTPLLTIGDLSSESLDNVADHESNKVD